MSPLRAPRLGGVAGGVGTTTLATALRAYDRGRMSTELDIDVLVCRSTGDSLHAAASLIAWLGSNARARPVLAVTSDGPMPIRGPLRARLRMIEPQVGGLVVLPYVAHWRELTDPLTEAARLSEIPSEQLPRPLRPYGEALVRVAEAVLRSGLLTPSGAPPRTAMDGPANRTIPTNAVPLPSMSNRTVPGVPPGALHDLPFQATAHGGNP
ncbi:hypothetical protein [Pseudonocardia acaciae]|uniref:hypothetical protein n=1 Tax=Pseudonocardia acaciae TaxID=551276 RepID=UPI0004921DF5|nr:hypothetical protein [Pseudonocardia acaciae]